MSRRVGVCGCGWEGWRWSQSASKRDSQSRCVLEIFESLRFATHCQPETESQRRDAKPDVAVDSCVDVAQIVPIAAFWLFQQSLDLVQWFRRGMEPKKSSRRRLAEAYGASIAQEFNKEGDDEKKEGEESAKVRGCQTLTQSSLRHRPCSHYVTLAISQDS